MSGRPPLRLSSRVSDRTVAELDDSLFSLLCMANEMGVEMEEVLRVTLVRCQKRLLSSRERRS